MTAYHIAWHRPDTAWRHGGFALACALIVVAAVAAIAITATAYHRRASTASAPPRAATVFDAQRDGTVLVSARNGASPRVIPLEAFRDSAFGTERQVAYDAPHRRLWYATDHVRIASIDIDTLQPGPAFESFSDVALFGCAVNGNPRTFAVDTQRNVLFVSMLQGNIVEYDLDTLEMQRAIAPTAFADPAVGTFRRIAVDPARHTLWYATADRRLIEMRLSDGRPTGRRAAVDASINSLAVDTQADRLVYITTNAGEHAVSLRTLQPLPASSPPGSTHSGIAFATP